MEPKQVGNADKITIDVLNERDFRVVAATTEIVIALIVNTILLSTLAALIIARKKNLQFLTII
jgi:hypothetical protein